MGKSKSGFTIVELLIVIVVISILASITVVAYQGVRNRSYESVVKSDLTQVAKKMAIFKVNSGNEKFPTAIAGSLRTGLEAVDIKVNAAAYSTVANSNFTYYVNDDGTDYVVMATVKNGPILYVRGNDPTVRENTSSTYPSGFPSNHATAAGLSPPWTSTSLDIYPAYVGNGGGWRIWN